MNTAFRFYGRQPSDDMQKVALMAQSKYNLNDMQLAGILQIHDFFIRMSVFDVSPMLMGMTYKKEHIKFPYKTKAFFSERYENCIDAQTHFNHVTGHKYFLRFIDSILKESFVLSDYVSYGVFEPIQVNHQEYTYAEAA